MDIYEYAESISYKADYYDFHTGYIYKIQNYGNALKLGLPTPGIEVVDSDGKTLGYASKK